MASGSESGQRINKGDMLKLAGERNEGLVITAINYSAKHQYIIYCVYYFSYSSIDILSNLYITIFIINLIGITSCIENKFFAIYLDIYNIIKPSTHSLTHSLCEWVSECVSEWKQFTILL